MKTFAEGMKEYEALKKEIHAGRGDESKPKKKGKSIWKKVEVTVRKKKKKQHETPKARRRRIRKGGTEKLKDVNKAAERKSMQSVGGFRGVHGASRKSKAGQGPAGKVEYRRKSPVEKKERKPLPKGTIVSIKKKIREFFGGLLPLELTDAALLREKYGDTFDNEKERAKTAEKEKELKKKKLIMQHGKKKYLQLQQQGKKAKEKLTKDPKGIRGTHKGKWGYFKGGKFKAD